MPRCMYMQARNVINYKVPNKKKKKKLGGRKDKYFFIREHRLLEAEFFQKQVHSTRNVQTWENE